jgi:Ca2+-dependent lipid-binding protein
MFSLKLSIHHLTQFGNVDFKTFEAWKKPPPKRLSSWKLRTYIYQCKDLPAADSEGSSDPYIEVWSTDKKKGRTITIEDNCNPIFFSCIEVYMDFSAKADAPPIILNIWDEDTGILDSTDDFIGRAVINIADAAISEDDTIPEPRWHKVIMGFSQNEPSIGSILVSFSLVPDDFRF